MNNVKPTCRNIVYIMLFKTKCLDFSSSVYCLTFFNANVTQLCTGHHYLIQNINQFKMKIKHRFNVAFLCSATRSINTVFNLAIVADTI